MYREINNNIYRLNFHSGGIRFIECETKGELFKYIIEQENKGFIIISVSLIQSNGKTPKIAFRTNKEYKAIKNELSKRKV